MLKGALGIVVTAAALLILPHSARAYDERIPFQLHRGATIRIVLHREVRRVRHHRRYKARYHRKAKHYARHHKHKTRVVRRHYRREALNAQAAFPVFEIPLLARAARYLGGNPTGWGRVWCGRFMRMVVGHDPGPRYNLARNWAHYGKATRRRPGAIAVMRGHVGIVARGGNCGPGRVYILSGNHGRRVGYGCYAASRIIAYRG